MQEGNTSKVQASQKDCASLDPNACVLQVNLCSMRHPLCIALGLTSLLCCVATGADLASTSPFVGAGAGATGAGGAGAPGGPIELRGEMLVEGQESFCIYDSAKKSGTWVQLNEGGHDFVVKKHDVAHDTVTVVYQGRTMLLALKEAKVGSAGPAVAPTLHGQPTVVQGIIGQQVPADDAQKIQAIAAEVARRRMLREQDMQKATQDGGAAAPASKGSGRLRAPQN